MIDTTEMREEKRGGDGSEVSNSPAVFAYSWTTRDPFWRGKGETKFSINKRKKENKKNECEVEVGIENMFDFHFNSCSNWMVKSGTNLEMWQSDAQIYHKVLCKLMY